MSDRRLFIRTDLGCFQEVKDDTFNTCGVCHYGLDDRCGRRASYAPNITGRLLLLIKNHLTGSMFFLIYALLLIRPLHGAALAGYHGILIINDVPQRLYGLYDSLIPQYEGFSVPDQRKIQILSIGANAEYLECSFSIIVKFDGQHYYFPLHIALNNFLGYVAGIPAGYPKVYAPACEMADGWPSRIRYEFDGCGDTSRWTLSAYSTTGQPEYAFDSIGWDLTINAGKCVNRHRIDLSPRKSEWYTAATISIHHFYNTPWARLIPVGNYDGIIYDIDSEIKFPMETIRCPHLYVTGLSSKRHASALRHVNEFDIRGRIIPEALSQQRSSLICLPVTTGSQILR